MYNNIGGKIKKLAAVVGWIGIIAGIAVAIAIWCGVGSFDEGVAFFIGLLIGVGIALVSWVSTWVLYGFGTIVEMSESQTFQLSQQKKPLEKLAGVSSNTEDEANEEADNPAPYYCQVCDNPGPYGDVCPKCGSSIKLYTNVNASAKFNA